MMPGLRVRARAWRGRGGIRLPAARRRHRLDAGAADDLDHRLRPRAARQDGPARRREGRATASWCPARSATRRWVSNSSRAALAAALGGDGREMLIGRYRVPQPRIGSGASGSRSRLGRDGRVRWPRRRSRQAVRGIWRLRRHRCAKHPVVRSASGHCEAAARPASNPSCPAATITRSCAPSRRIASRRSRRPQSLPGVPVTSIGTIIAGAAVPKFIDGQGRGISAAAAVLEPFLRLFGQTGSRGQFPPNTCENRPFRPFAALRRGSDFGMVPPI